MGAKLRTIGLLAVGALAGALTTMQLQANARSALAPLPLEELQQLAAVFGMVKSEYVEPVGNSARAPAASSSASASRWAWKTAW